MIFFWNLPRLDDIGMISEPQQGTVSATRMRFGKLMHCRYAHRLMHKDDVGKCGLLSPEAAP